MALRTWCALSFQNHHGRACGGMAHSLQSSFKCKKSRPPPSTPLLLPGGERARWFLTESIEPPLQSTVPEKPCAVVLAENQFCYEHNNLVPSWSQRFRHDFPRERGIQYCEFQFSKSSLSLESVLKELENDLATIPHTILIARGPLYSWIAPYYLESLPLAGLVLVDPLVTNHDGSSSNNNSCTDGETGDGNDKLHAWLEAFKALHTDTNGEMMNGGSSSKKNNKYGKEQTHSESTRSTMDDNDSQRRHQQTQDQDNITKNHEYAMMKRILHGEEQRPLQLEAGSVPMLVLHTATSSNHFLSTMISNDDDHNLNEKEQEDLFQKSAHIIANRHSVHPGDVPVKGVGIDNNNYSGTNTTMEDEVIDIICDWIDECVL